MLRIQEIVAYTEQPRSSVYENLKVLFERGLAEEFIESNFKYIRAYPLTVLRSDIQTKIQNLKYLEQDLDKLDEAVASIAATNEEPTTSVRYYKGVSGGRQLLWNTLKARDTVYVYSAWGRGSYVGSKFYQNFVAESRVRQIREQVLINPSERVLQSIKTYQGTEISRTKADDIRTVDEQDIAINGETFIYNNVYAQIYLQGHIIYGFEIHSRQFADSQASIFRTLWRSAQPLKL